MNQFLPEAKEAKEQVESCLYAVAQKQMVEIANGIKGAIGTGKFEAYFSGILEPGNKLILENKGYTVNSGSQYSESQFNVSWR